MERVCSSCKRSTVSELGSVKFMCPNCGKQELVRCKKCRMMAAKYSCPECNFEGPN